MEEIAFETIVYTGPYPITTLKGQGPEGTWHVGRERDSADIRFQLARPEGMSFMDVLEARKQFDDPHNPEYWRMSAMSSPNDVGFVLNHALAPSFINAVRTSAEGDVADILKAAGFEFQHEIKPAGRGPVQVYDKNFPKVGYVTVYLGEYDIDIDFQQPRKDYWWNVGSFQDRHENAAFGGTAYHFVPFPHFRAGLARWTISAAIPWLLENHKTLKLSSGY